MISNVNIYRNILVIIVTLYFLTTCTHQYELDKFYNVNGTGKLFRPGVDGCSVPAPSKHEPKKPKPSCLGATKHDCYQERNYYNIKPSRFLRFACDSGKILAVKNEMIAPRILVKCSRNNELQFRRKNFTYQDFTCEDFPDFDDIKVNSSSKSHLTRDISAYDCFLPFPGVDYYMPIPFTNTSNPMIIHPDLNGNLVISQNDYFRMACTGVHNDFVSPGPERGLKEISVKCLNGSYIEYRGKIHTLLDFACAAVPKPTIQLTDKMCHNDEHNVFEVGFQTSYHFIKMYRLCFDMVNKNAKYSWYFANTPLYPERQIIKKKMFYINTKLYYNFEPRQAYLNQTDTMLKILKSKKMTHYYIKKDEGRLLTPCHLMSKKEFIYAFEQWSTFFYENTVPQWYIYNVRVWKYLQITLNKALARDYTRHLIVAGTYNISSLGVRPNAPNETYPLYLSLPKSLVVPLYIWKMDYDMDRRNATVYIGYNNPYKEIDIKVYFCNAMPCPTRILAKKAFEKDLLFCCSKKDFERTYGRIDPIVFKDF